MLRRSKVLSWCLLACMVLTGCQSNSDKGVQDTSERGEDEKRMENQVKEPVSQDIFAMDTYMTVTAYGDTAQEAVSEAVEEIQRLDALLSTGNENSEVYKLNQAGGGTLSEDTCYLLERSLELWKDTDGRFEVGIYPVMQAWGFTDGEYQVPSGEELQQLIALADSSKISFDEENSAVTFGLEGMEIDLGGIAKGYTSSRIMDIYREHGVSSGLVSLGGNVQAMGSRPDGNPWRVAIQNPSGGDDYLGVLEAEDCAVITSGGYERYFEEDGIVYHHIIDPGTGYPADSGLTSVTIVSPDGTLADGLSTSLFIMGREEAERYWQQHSGEFDVILLDRDENLYITEGIADQFTSEREIQVIEKG